MNNSMRVKTDQKISTSTSSAASSAFGSNVEYIRIVSDTTCWITFGTSPTATNSKTYLPAGEVEYYKVSEGEKVAAILASGTGNLYVAELVE
jgi:hypothetical protein